MRHLVLLFIVYIKLLETQIYYFDMIFSDGCILYCFSKVPHQFTIGKGVP